MNMNHRKLISDTVTINITAFCEPFCDPRKSFFSNCPDVCFYNCPSSCNISPPLVIVTNVHHSRAPDKLHRSLICVLSLVGLACLLYCFFNLYKHYKSTRRRPLQPQETHDHDEFIIDEDQGPILDHPIWYIRTVGLETSVIDSIGVCKYKRGEGLIEGTDCSVCLSEFEADETLRLLPKCNHAFHVPCIDTWLRSHTNCPLCRSPIVSVPNRTLYPSLEQSFAEDDQQEVVVSEEREEPARGRNNRDFGSKSDGSSRYWRRINENGETNEVQPMRRSISMDLDSILSTIANNIEDLNKMNTGIVQESGNFSLSGQNLDIDSALSP